MSMQTNNFGEEPKQIQGAENATLQVGATLQGRYKIAGVLGVGGMGAVYKARDMNFPNVQRLVAVKEMLNTQSDPTHREQTLKGFEREANILAELNHPSIPKIFDYFSSKDRAYLVMEYINGYDLEALMNRQQNFLPQEMIVKWGIQLCDVLHYLHTHEPEPIIFRDVKPSNTMIDQFGNVRLIDFGIARNFQPNQGKVTMVGTEGYAPPEQYRGMASPQGDLYAVGATLHHVLTRRDPRLEPPFSFQDRPVRESNPTCSPELETIVMRSLEYEPAKRFKSALEMKQLLEALSKPAGGVAVAGADGVAEEANFTDAGKIAPRWKFRCEDEIRSTPLLHKGMLYIGAYDNNLYALDAEKGELKWKYPTEGGIVGTPNIDADNNLVIFGSEDNYLHAVDTRTGKVNWTFKTNGPIRGTVNVSLGHVFFGSDDGTLYAVRLGGRMVWKYDSAAPIRSRPAVTAERIVFGNQEGDVVGLDLSGAIKWRLKAKRAVTSSPIIVDDIAYFGSVDSQVYAVDINNGWSAWRARCSKPIVSTPLIVGKQLFIGCADNLMYCFDIGANGKELWKFETKGQIVSSPVFRNDAIYFGSTDKSIYSVEIKKGKQRWAFETGGYVVGSGIVTDSTLYIGSSDHYLYAMSL